MSAASGLRLAVRVHLNACSHSFAVLEAASAYVLPCESVTPVAVVEPDAPANTISVAPAGTAVLTLTLYVADDAEEVRVPAV